MNHSEIAKSGYNNEQWLADMLSSWSGSLIAKQVITAVGHPDALDVVSLRSRDKREKTDVWATVYKKGNQTVSETFSCKKMAADTKNGFGHVCRSSVDSYASKFGFNHRVRESLMAYSGEYIVEGKRGVYFDHCFFDRPRKQEIVDFFNSQFSQVIRTIFAGARFKTPPKWFTITADTGESKVLFLTDLETAIEYAKGDGRVWFGKSEVNQNLVLGNVVMYRKNNNLQFKMNYRPMIKELKHKFRVFHF